MYYKVLMELGHMGAGKSIEIVRYFEADDAVSLFNRLKHYPAIKSKKCGLGIGMIEAVTGEEYNAGRKKDKMDYCDMRQHVRKYLTEEHTTTILPESKHFPPLPAQIIDYSTGGICLKYQGEKLSINSKYYIDGGALGASKKEAVVVWSGEKNWNNNFKSGFQWL